VGKTVNHEFDVCSCQQNKIYLHLFHELCLSVKFGLTTTIFSTRALTASCFFFRVGNEQVLFETKYRCVFIYIAVPNHIWQRKR